MIGAGAMEHAEHWDNQVLYETPCGTCGDFRACGCEPPDPEDCFDTCPDCGAGVATGEPYAPFCCIDHRAAYFEAMS